ncbi:MAG: methyltransferase domain-containing protein [Gemmatales bacterium]
MSQGQERNYILGTHDEELRRLDLQHRVWLPTVLDCWYRAGITVGSKVLDIGAGPGFATLDLAETVSPRGQVVALERSQRFLEAARSACLVRGLKQVTFHELDLMTDAWPTLSVDAAWCRWVACFVSSPAELIQKIALSVRPGGRAIFHEYANYASWRWLPHRPLLEDYVRQVMKTWRSSGGEPDIGLELPRLLQQAGFTIREAVPRVFCVRPDHFIWRWPAAFIDSGLNRFLELKEVTEDWANAVRQEFQAAQADPNTLMMTPLVLEIVAEKR